MSHGSGVSWFAMGRFDMVTAGMWLAKKHYQVVPQLPTLMPLETGLRSEGRAVTECLSCVPRSRDDSVRS